MIVIQKGEVHRVIQALSQHLCGDVERRYKEGWDKDCGRRRDDGVPGAA